MDLVVILSLELLLYHMKMVMMYQLGDQNEKWSHFSDGNLIMQFVVLIMVGKVMMSPLGLAL